MNLAGSFIIAFSMYSRIPMPQIAWTEKRMRYAMCFFPFVGVVIGAVLLLLQWGREVFQLNPILYACLGTVIPLIITGGIHMDGFLDVVDARSSYDTRERKLEILKDPHAGAFAIIWCGIYLILYAGFFSQLSSQGLFVFSGTFVFTRALSGLSVVTFPMAKSSGLAAAFSGQANKRMTAFIMGIIIVADSLFLLYAGVRKGLFCLIVGGLTFYYYYRMSKKEFGGITGDLAGCFLQICELLLLIAAALL